MTEPMHPVFTEVPQRSYNAIVGNGWLSEVLLALVVDPLEAEDLAATIRRGAGIRLDIVPAHSGSKPYPAPVTVADFASAGANVLSTWRITVAQWVRTQSEAQDALSALVEYDRRIGVWCACQVARQVLRYVDDRRQRSRTAIETAESWVRGEVTNAQVRRDGDAAAYAYAGDHAADAGYSAIATIYVGMAHCSDTAHHAAASVAFESAAYGSPEWTTAYRSELVRLREVVASACLTFPAGTSS